MQMAQWRHIQCLQRKLVAEITAYKNSAHADSATKKQLRFSKNTTRKELKDAWAFFEKHEREFMNIQDGECHAHDEDDSRLFRLDIGGEMKTAGGRTPVAICTRIEKKVTACA